MTSWDKKKNDPAEREDDPLKQLGDLMKKRFDEVMDEPIPKEMVELLNELERRERDKSGSK